MSNMTALNGNLFLSTNPSNPATSLSISRTDAGNANPLAQIRLSGSGTNSLQGTIVLQTMNSGTQDGPLQERMRVHANGNIGIGTTNPQHGRLMIEDSAVPLSVHETGQSVTAGGLWRMPLDAGTLRFDVNTAANGDFSTYLNPLAMTADGRVGIGTMTPEAKLDVRGAIRAGNSDLYFTDPNHNYTGIGNTAGYAAIENAKDHDALMILGRAGTAVGRKVRLWDYLEVNGPLDVVTNLVVRGHIGVNGQPPEPRGQGWGGGIHTWDLEAEGTIWSRSGYQSGNRDLAENYVSHTELEPGDVVCLVPDRDTIVRSDRPNDALICGVVSLKPGVLLNVDADYEPSLDKKLFPVALAGRVPCKVVDESGPIRRGDLLTTSSTPGHAMKARPLMIDGDPFYRPGTIIGKALKSLESGTGVIEVFITLA